ncbi:hypothetical protein COLO4_24288 [Corchorus olitorius]|uniref:Uncharacterized protein n=1 Tax=Corchorus olitorius TaxID=93759 RepID=A0A1R3IBH4_9ROSI|nr:hypothetical protein COLO4_24288 [Corchorus olitorius]
MAWREKKGIAVVFFYTGLYLLYAILAIAFVFGLSCFVPKI